MPVDPAVLGQLMLDTAAVNADAEAWKNQFGFEHNCHCDEDYANDAMGTVTECWALMAEDAIETCSIFKSALDGSSCN